MNRFLAILFLLGCLLIAAATGHAQQSRPAAQKPKAATAEQRASKGVLARSITGRVLSEGGQPVVEASVMLVPAGALSSQSIIKGLMNRTTITDEQGRFKLDDLDRGAYSIMAYVPGYVTASGTADDDGKERYIRPGDSVTIRMTKGAVITGTVTGPAGEPMIGVRVRATSVRGPEGRTARATLLTPFKEWKTDDRGVYRIYGLDPGTYVVAAGGKGFAPFGAGPYDNDAPTYYPSGTRDTAREVTVQSGDEARGIDIRYRDNQGHIISGTVSSPTGVSGFGFAVILNQAYGSAYVSWTVTIMPESNGAFALSGVPDGDYDVTAISIAESEQITTSPPHRVSVRGADVTGIELVASPLGSIAGRITLEQAPAALHAPDCEKKRHASVEEAVIAVRNNEKGKTSTSPISRLPFNIFSISSDSPIDDKGEFSIRPLDGGRYRIAAQFPTDDWFVRSITLPAAQPDRQPNDAARNGIAVKSGEQVKGVVITLAEGAAGMRGRVVAAKEGAEFPQRLRVHLVPAEREHSDNVLRYGEVGVQQDGSFALANLAPGRYWIIARPVSDETPDDAIRPAAWDAESRAALRREAEVVNTAIDLQPCRRLADYLLKYAPATKAK